MTQRLAELTTLRLGGPARRLIEARTEAELVEAVRGADRDRESLLVLGGGSNVVVADAGFAGTAVHVLSAGVEQRAGGELEVQAGEPWDPLVERCVADGLAGFECLSGIPGSAGGTPIQNVGAYGQEVSETIRSVRVLDRASGTVDEMAPEQCGFSYRSSVFKRAPGRYVVLGARFTLERDDRSRPIRYRELARALGVEPGARVPLGEVRRAVLALRRGKGMVIDPGDPDSVSAGSFFTNPVLDPRAFEQLEQRARDRYGEDSRPPRFPHDGGRIKTSAAWLIERAGFGRGYGDPRTIAISSKHTLALTNRGAGSTSALVALAEEIAAGVAHELGVALVPEPVFVGHSWNGPAGGADLPTQASEPD